MATDGMTLLKKQSAQLNDQKEIAGQDVGTANIETNAKPTIKKPERARVSAPDKDLPELNNPKVAMQEEWKPGGIWPKGKKVMDIYQIEGVLGEGGMDLVYKVRGLATNRPVVIKSLYSSWP